MELALAYLGRSRVDRKAGRAAVTFSPNLRRSVVSFDATLAKPLRFREAVSALHEVVVSDLRYKPRHKTAWREWLANRGREEGRVRHTAHAQATATLAEMAGRAPDPILAQQFEECRRAYWDARIEIGRAHV